jgi:hypothetical protein
VHDARFVGGAESLAVNAHLDRLARRHGAFAKPLAKRFARQQFADEYGVPSCVPTS